MFPRRIYLCGGGVAIVAHVGVLEELDKYGALRFVKEWMGISAGALYALCLSLKFTLKECRQFICNFDMTAIMDPDELTGWICNYGFDTGNKLKKLAEAFLHEKGFASNATFADLAAKGCTDLRVFATNLNTGKLMEFSRFKTPTYSISNAIRASMTLPYYFQPFQCPESGHYYYDGGVISNYPLRFLPEEEVKETLGVLFFKQVGVVETIGLNEILFRPTAIMFREDCNTEILGFEKQTICVNMGVINPVNFEISSEEKNKLIELGAIATRNFLKNFRKPARRYSVG